VALYPFVDGESFGWGVFATPAHRRAVFDMVVAVHTAPGTVGRRALADDFAIPHRDELAAALDGATGVADTGPYARPTAELLADNAPPIRRLLARYDQLVVAGREQPSRMVLTHGEPHPGNTMQAAGEWLLIDWDTALMAPPERDLWSLDPGDGSILDAYAAATGVTPLPSMIELYRIRWDLADLAVCVDRFRGRHVGNPDDDASWDILRSLVRAFPL
jgi:spectinomycin phosphotransferase/16S rRNA (guanine(1405)-N(7))-methyltransferase